MDPNPVFHEGELAMQARAGTTSVAARGGSMVQTSISAAAGAFLERQSMLVVGSTDGGGQPWASVVFGAAGFAGPIDGSRLRWRRRRIWHDIQVPPGPTSRLREGDELGILAIELDTRKRLRINGVCLHVDDEVVDVQVREAYPNCPKYVRRRRLVSLVPRRPILAEERAIAAGPLSLAASELVTDSDTFFVASRHPARGLDVSHRGGPPGFVCCVDGRTLHVPDYAGNGMFNTLGNLHVDDRAGLLFVDFERDVLLQIAGRAAVVEDGTPPLGRAWQVRVEQWRFVPLDVATRWEHLEPSPHSPGSGDEGTSCPRR